MKRKKRSFVNRFFFQSVPPKAKTLSLLQSRLACNPKRSLPIPLASDPKQLGKAKFGLLACQVSGLMFTIDLDFLSS